jgi:hypothetical protein
MVDVEHHRINRQILEVSLPSATNAIEIQQLMGSVFRSRALPELESLFDRVAGPTRVVRIPRLEVDLGSLQGPDWIEAFVERVVTEVGAALAGRHVTAAAEQAARAFEGSSRDVPFQQMLFYLEHGHLPWWGPRPSTAGATARRLVVDERAMATVHWSALRVVLGASGPRLRFVRLRDPELLARTARELGGLPNAAQVCDRLTPEHASPTAKRRWQDTFWDRVLAEAARGVLGVDGRSCERWPSSGRGRARPTTSPCPRRRRRAREDSPWRRWPRHPLRGRARRVGPTRPRTGPSATSRALRLAPSRATASPRANRLRPRFGPRGPRSRIFPLPGATGSASSETTQWPWCPLPWPPAPRALAPSRRSKSARPHRPPPASLVPAIGVLASRCDPSVPTRACPVRARAW